MEAEKHRIDRAATSLDPYQPGPIEDRPSRPALLGSVRTGLTDRPPLVAGPIPDWVDGQHKSTATHSDVCGSAYTVIPPTPALPTQLTLRNCASPIIEVGYNSPMSDDPPRQHEFLFGEVFRADDPVAQFIVSLAAASNDAVFLHDLWLGDDAAHQARYTEEENVWFMRQAMSQLWEARDLIRKAETYDEIASWLTELDGETAEYLANLRLVLDRLVEGNDGKERLGKARNHTWHYPSPGAALKKAMRSLEATTQRVVTRGPALKDTRASFADEVMFRIAFDEMSGDDFRSFVRDVLRPGVQAVMNFGSRAYGHYIDQTNS